MRLRSPDEQREICDGVDGKLLRLQCMSPVRAPTAREIIQGKTTTTAE
jgi:hypothetical protein